MLIWIFVIVISILIDQLSKILVVAFLSRESSLEIIRGVFQLTYVENDGAAFGLLGEHRWIFMVLSLVGIAALCVYLFKFKPDSKLACLAISLIIGGGIGNMIDRCFRMGTLPETVGKHVVIDFLDFCAFPDYWMWIFNIADACVCVGAGLLILYMIIDIIKDGKRSVELKATEKSSQSNGEDKDE